MVFSVRVRQHFMIAHSFRGEAFGPAQALHGATYVVDAEFSCEKLQPDTNMVVDIALALDVLKETLEPLNYKNLDDVEEMKGINTTTEWLAWFIHGKVARRMADAFTGNLKITLAESHIAWAAYEGPVGK